MRRVVFICVFLLCFFGAFATGILYTYDSSTVQALFGLYREAGYVLPGFIYPVSADTLLKTIEYSDLENALYGVSLERLEEIKAELNGDDIPFRLSEDFAFTPKAEASVVAYSQSADEKDIIKSRYFYMPGYEAPYRYNQIPPFLKGGFDLYLTNYATGHFEYEYSANFEEYTSDKTQSNIPLRRDRNSSVPYNTYLQVGTPKLYVYVGRVRSSSGSGITGNLAVGDNFLFRNTLKVQINALPFVYELYINRFDAEELDFDVNTEYKDTYSSNLTHISRLDARAPIMVMHKVNFLILKNLNVGVYEALLDYSKASLADPKLLGPFNLFHNMLSYQYDSNNFFGFDADFSPVKNLQFHTEFIFDQIQLSDEKEKKVPGAFGALINARYSFPFKGQKFSFYSEVVYTSPFLYLKPSGDYSSTEDNYYTLDLIVGNYHMHDSKVDTAPLGYKYGPNSLVGNFGFVWEKNRNTFVFDFLIKSSGDTGVFLNDKTPTGKSEYVNATSPYILGSGSPQVLSQISLIDKYNVLGDNSVLLEAGLTFQFYDNYNFETGRDLTNVIYSIGCKIFPLKRPLEKRVNK